MVLAMVFEWRVGLVALSFFPIVAVVIYYQGKATGEEAIGHVKSLEDSTIVCSFLINFVIVVRIFLFKTMSLNAEILKKI